MKRLPVFLVVVTIAAALVLSGCGQAAPPAPTQAPAAQPTKVPVAAPTAQPTKAPEPTKATEPTAAPAKKVEYPVKGKAISVIVPWAPGGGNDILARLAAPSLEQELGTSVQILNRPGAGGQVGFAEAAKSAPDGYTIGMTVLPPIANIYLDPERQATFNRSSFLPIALVALEPVLIVVRTDSRFKTAKDLIDAAKASPEGVKMADSGLGSTAHATVLALEHAAGVKFGQVHFNGDSEIFTNLLGGHVEVGSVSTAGAMSHFKSGAIRVLGLSNKEVSPFYPGVPTFASEGYEMNVSVSRGFSFPAGTPKEFAEIVSAAFKKTADSEDFQKRAADAGIPVKYLNATQYGDHWASLEKELVPLIELIRKSK
jgi:tripartite-type tricarboxylate transporter receptor subunit TctC